MKRILFTGFGPFSDIKVNPSEILVNYLCKAFQDEGKVHVSKLILPVDYGKAGDILKTINFSDYDFIFEFGVAAKRQRISLERVALNWMESSIPDNSGVHANQRSIEVGGPEAKFNSLDLVKLCQDLNSEFHDTTEVSLSAGAYLCNFVYFKSLVQTSCCLFIHIPAKLIWLNQELSCEDSDYQRVVQDISKSLINKII